jgi:hypothetical protein
MSDTPQPPRPTVGQQRILQLCCRVAYVLVATQQTSGESYVYYRIRDRSDGRPVQRVTTAMVNGLRQAGWIEHVPGGDVSEWTYRVTETGIAAANA